MTGTVTPFSGLNQNSVMAAKYSLQSMSYNWIKAYSPYNCCSDSIIVSLNQSEDTLAIVITVAKSFYIYLIDTQTGIEKYNFITVSPFRYSCIIFADFMEMSFNANAFLSCSFILFCLPFPT